MIYPSHHRRGRVLGGGGGINLLVGDVLRVFAEGKLDGGLVEAGVAHDAQILMVLLTLVEALLEVASGLQQQ